MVALYPKYIIYIYRKKVYQGYHKNEYIRVIRAIRVIVTEEEGITGEFHEAERHRITKTSIRVIRVIKSNQKATSERYQGLSRIIRATYVMTKGSCSVSNTFNPLFFFFFFFNSGSFP